MFGFGRKKTDRMRLRARRRIPNRSSSRNGKRKSDILLDKHGLPIGYETMVIMDEFGNVGPKHEHERNFGMAMTVTNRPDVYESLTEYNRQIYPETEIKAAKDPRSYDIAGDIGTLGISTYGIYVDKEHAPIDWYELESRKRQLAMIGISLEAVIPTIHGNVYVVVDHHSAYRGSLPEIIRGFSNEGRIVDGDKYDSRDGQFSGLLQTHDTVANSIRGEVELGDKTRTKRFKPVIRKVDEDVRIGKYL